MIIHYLKISLRNLWKYKTHSLISALCLAVGIVCYILSAWTKGSPPENVMPDNRGFSMN